MMSNSYNYVVFDIGDVLLAFRPRNYLNKIYHEIKVEQLIDEVFHQPEFAEYEKGTYTSTQLSELYMHRFPQHAKEIKDMIDHWAELNTYMEDSWRLVKEIKRQGIPVYLLSTMGKEWKEAVFAQYDDFKLVDGCVFSYEVHANKPDKKIYQTLFERYGLHPENGIFIDDRKKNVEQAISLGMNGICFTVCQEVRKTLIGLMKS